MAVSFAQLLRDHRIKHNWSQQQLADKVGVDRCYIGMLERGIRRNPSQEVLQKITQALDLTLAEKQEIFLAIQGAVPSKPLKSRRRSPIEDALSEFLALPPDSPSAWDKLVKVFKRLQAILSERGFTREEKRQADLLSLLTQGYAFPVLPRKGRRKQASEKKPSVPRNQRDRIRIAQRLCSLLEIFVRGKMPPSVKAALAEDLFLRAQSSSDEYKRKLTVKSKSKGKSGKKGQRAKRG